MPAKGDVFRKVYGLSPTVTFDRAFSPVIQGDSLFFGSSADDGIHCLDATTGQTRWTFTTEGPVRLAPTVAGSRVYAGSDDGCVYCLDAADGRLVWKHRGGNEDRRLPGNGRMISLWPVRSGVVVDGGTAYFCAGLFPSQGAYLAALDAADGRPLWKQQVDVSSQGYLLASPTRLFLPTGRTSPHIYSRDTGEQVAAFSGSGQQGSGFPFGGGCFGVLVEETLVHGGGEIGGLRFVDTRTREKIVAAAGLRLLADGPIAYILDQDRLSALDRDHYVELARLQQKKEKTDADQRRIAELGGEQKAYLKWDVPCSTPYELIMAGGTLFAGGDDRVVAYDKTSGRQVWTANVSGSAYALSVSGGRLFVGTDSGAIHCFGPPASAKPATAVPAPSPDAERFYPSDALSPVYQAAAEASLRAAQTDQGYCLVLGAGTGRLAYAIAQRSRFRVVGVEPNAEKVSAARSILTQAGMYGNRIVIHHGSLEKLPYQKRFANLIVSDEVIATGKLPPSAAEVFRLLRPEGGVVALTTPGDRSSEESLRNWAAGAIAGWTVEERPGGLLVGTARRGPLEGAGEWTHLYGDGGNSSCSQDSLAYGPVDIQWFGPPGPRRMVDRHEKNVGPLYKDGRLFISGDNYLVAMDAYNGTLLWQRDLPESIRLGALKNCGSMALGDDLLYVAAGGRSVGFEVASGRQAVSFAMPNTSPGDGREWGYIAAAGNVLFGSASKPGATFRVQDIDTQTLIWRDDQPVVTSESLFALDRHSGRALWTFKPDEGAILNPTIAVAAGRVYCIHSANAKTRDVADGRITLDVLLDEGAFLVALDAITGNLVWKRPIDLSALEHAVFLSHADETLVITGTKNVSVPGSDKKRVRYDLWALDPATGDPLWNSTQTPVPDHILDGPHGEQVQHSAIVGGVIYNTGFALKLRSGEPAPGWKWQKSDKCGTSTTSASCIFSRFSSPRMFDLASGEHVSLTEVTRPGCWINIIPAGGMVLIPESSSGCTCSYPIQTSLALTPRDGKP
jgi:outer membrane protein assembly factor BamB